MNALICELCQSNDIVKQNGFYVCQHCGTKYTVEEAKKLFSDGSVEITGSVSIDNSSKLPDLYEVARRAKNTGDYETAIKFYDEILLSDPKSWEASFYTVFCKGMNCKRFEIGKYADMMNGCLNNIISLIKNNIADEEEQYKCVVEVFDNTVQIAASFDSNIVAMMRSGHVTEHLSKAAGAAFVYISLGNAIETYYGDNSKFLVMASLVWDMGIKVLKESKARLVDDTEVYIKKQNLSKADREKFRANYNVFDEDINKYTVKSEATKRGEKVPEINEESIKKYSSETNNGAATTPTIDSKIDRVEEIDAELAKLSKPFNIQTLYIIFVLAGGFCLLMALLSGFSDMPMLIAGMLLFVVGVIAIRVDSKKKAPIMQKIKELNKEKKELAKKS